MVLTMALTKQGIPNHAVFHSGAWSHTERDVVHAEEGAVGVQGSVGGVTAAKAAVLVVLRMQDRAMRASIRACHLHIEDDLPQLVEHVGKDAAQCGDKFRREKHRDGRGNWGERNAGHGESLARRMLKAGRRALDGRAYIPRHVGVGVGMAWYDASQRDRRSWWGACPAQRLGRQFKGLHSSIIMEEERGEVKLF
jgi:hypothetical protein